MVHVTIVGNSCMLSGVTLLKLEQETRIIEAIELVAACDYTCNALYVMYYYNIMYKYIPMVSQCDSSTYLANTLIDNSEQIPSQK